MIISPVRPCLVPASIVEPFNDPTVAQGNVHLKTPTVLNEKPSTSLFKHTQAVATAHPPVDADEARDPSGYSSSYTLYILTRAHLDTSTITRITCCGESGYGGCLLMRCQGSADMDDV